MAIGWEVPRSGRYRLAPAAALVVAAALAVLAVLTVLAVTEHRSPDPVGVDAGGPTGSGPTRAQTAATAASTGAPASADTTTGRAEASSKHSVTYSSDDSGAGLVVTNAGAATADVGGNVVVGSDQPDGSAASVSTGDATAVGNHSSTAIGP